MTNSGMDNYVKTLDFVSGRYGPVYQARHRTTGEVVVVKEFYSREGYYFGLREKEILTCMPTSKYVVRLLASHWKDEKGKKKTLCLVFEDRGQFVPLSVQLHQQQTLSINDIKGLLYLFLMGLDHCHRADIIHRGLKPENLMVHLGDRMGIRVTDFRWAKRLSALHELVSYGDGNYISDDEDLPHFTPPGEFVTANLNYVAPELLMEAKSYSQKVDIWSLAMIFAEMMIGRPLVKTVKSTHGQLRCIFGVLGKPSVSERTLIPGIQHFKWSMFDNIPAARGKDLSVLVPGLDTDGIDLLSKMLDWVPSRRISANQALSHVFFQDAPLMKFF